MSETGGKQSRLERLRAEMKNDLYAPPMPPIEGGAYLIPYLFEVGPTMAAGMGVGPITHEELQSWQRGIGLSLDAWEFRFLRRLSIEYVTESRKAEKADCPTPWLDPDSEEYRLHVLPERIRSFLREP